MLDPTDVTRIVAEWNEKLAHESRANLKNITMAQRNALVTLLGGPAAHHVSGVNRGWIVKEAGPRFAIEHTTVRALVGEGLVIIGGDALARLTVKGRWYAMSAAADEADRLMAALLNG